MPKSRNVAADYLRVVSILYIVGCWHLLGYTKPAPWVFETPPLSYLTVLALAIFVFLSGYFIGGKQLTSRSDIWGFYRTRLWTVYIPALIATLAFIVVGYGDRRELIQGALLVGMLIDEAPNTLWFVNMIVLFYVTTPLLLALKNNAVTYVGFSAIVEITLLAANILWGAIDDRLPLYFPTFSVAILLAGKSPSWPVIAASLAAAIVGLLGTVSLPVELLQYDARLAAWATFGSLGVVAATLRLGQNWRPSRLLDVLAEASFFIYLLHRVIFKIASKLLPFDGPWSVTLELLLVGLPLTIIIAWGLHRIYVRCLAEARKRSPLPVF